MQAALALSPMVTHEIKPAKLRKFIFAGNATLTIRNRKTPEGSHYTLKFQTLKKADKDVTFVRFLGANADYHFAGTIFGKKVFRTSRRGNLSDDAMVVKIIKWLLRNIDSPDNLSQAIIQHEGVCCVCNRPLTTPESIENGIGPVCAGKVNW